MSLFAHADSRLPGSRFGKLTIIADSGRSPRGRLLLKCICDCGEEKIADWGSLQQGRTQSCGCLRGRPDMSTLPNFIGRRFGRLIILRKSGTRDGKLMVECQCDCGVVKAIRWAQLHKGATRSCGCFQKEQALIGCAAGLLKWKKPIGQAARNIAIRNYTLGASRRGIEWALTEAEVVKLFGSNCHYCGAAPENVAGCLRSNGKFTYSGIDRLDSSRGYLPDNVVPCCSKCNRMKMEMPVEEFFARVARIVENHPELLTRVFTQTKLKLCS